MSTEAAPLALVSALEITLPSGLRNVTLAPAPKAPKAGTTLMSLTGVTGVGGTGGTGGTGVGGTGVMGVGVMGVTEGVSELEPPPQPDSRAIGRTSVAKSLKIFMVVTLWANDPKNNCIYGLNINALGLSTPKDGPSASSTITVLIYALLNNRKIKNTFAMTGEVSLDGNISEIGGLEYKILGSLKSLVTSFIFPRENEKDFQEFMKKYNKDDKMKDIQFYPVSTIQEVFEIILEKE
jgi:hypothetical protein